MPFEPSRRHFLRASAAMAGAGLLQACGSSQTPKPTVRSTNNTPQRISAVRQPIKSTSSGHTILRVVAPSGFAENTGRAEIGLSHLSNAGFVVTNQQAIYRRYSRFAGSDAERAADFQDVATGRVETPKVMMGLRGGYGAARLLPNIDFASLGARMRERGTLFFGFSDVCAIQLALLSKGNMMSFAGPMVYSEFGKPTPSIYTMDAFIRGTTQPVNSITVSDIQRRDVNVEGTLWGGNLSVVSSLAGTPYLPDINGGILFLEDVSEQPYRIERMLQTLHLSGVLAKQSAIIFGNFRMAGVRDSYDSSYDFGAVVNALQRVVRVPILTGFPFGHITNKVTFPLGAQAKVKSNGVGGYSVTFSGYPTLDASQLSLNTLLPLPTSTIDDYSTPSAAIPAEDAVTE